MVGPTGIPASGRMTRSLLFYMVVSAAIIVSEALFDEGSNELYALRYSIPGGGIPGEDYPILAVVPDTEFSCDGKSKEGYYPDPYTFCQVFHICHQGIKWMKDSFLCPNGTIFNTEKNGCHWWFDSECSSKIAQGSRVVPSISHGSVSVKSVLGGNFVHKTLPDQTSDASAHQDHTTLSKNNDNAVYRPVSELLESQRFEDGENLGLHKFLQSSTSNHNISPSKGNSVPNPSLNTLADATNTDLAESQPSTFTHSSNSNGFSYGFTTAYESTGNNPNLRTIQNRDPSVTFTQNSPESVNISPEEISNPEHSLTSIYPQGTDKSSDIFNEGLSSPQFVNNHFDNERVISPSGNTHVSLGTDYKVSLFGADGLENPSHGALPNLGGSVTAQFGIEDNANQARNTGFKISTPGDLPNSSGNGHSLLGIEGNFSPQETPGIRNPLPGVLPIPSGTKYTSVGTKDTYGQEGNNGFDVSLPGTVPFNSGTRKSSFAGNTGFGAPIQGAAPDTSGTRQSFLEIPGTTGLGIPLPGPLPGSRGTQHSSLGVEGHIGQQGITGIEIPSEGVLPIPSGTKLASIGIYDTFGQAGNSEFGVLSPGTVPDTSVNGKSSLAIEDNVSLAGNTGFGLPIPGAEPGTSISSQFSFEIEDSGNLPGSTGLGMPLPGSLQGSSETRHPSFGLEGHIGQPGTTGLEIPLQGVLPIPSGTKHTSIGEEGRFGQTGNTGFGVLLPGTIPDASGNGKSSFEIQDNVSLAGNNGFGFPISGAAPGTSRTRQSSFEIKDNVNLQGTTGLDIPLPGSLPGSSGTQYSTVGVEIHNGQSGTTGIGIPIPGIFPNPGETGHRTVKLEDNINLEGTTGLRIPLPSPSEPIHSSLGIEKNIGSIRQTSGIQDSSQLETTDLWNHSQGDLASFDTTSGFRNHLHGSLSSLSSTRGIPVECRQTRTDLELSPELSALRTNIWGDGVPGVDYPVLSSIIRTRFLCQDYAMDGFYADPEACCQVFHRCFNRGRGWWEQESFLCPNGTIFNQKVNTCIRWNEPYWWDGVSCSESEKFYPSAISNETVQEGSETNDNPTIVTGFNVHSDINTDSNLHNTQADEDPNLTVFDEYGQVGSDEVSYPIENNDYDVRSNEGPQVINELSSTSNDEVTKLDEFGEHNPSNNLPNFAAGNINFDTVWEASPSDSIGRSIINPTEYETSYTEENNPTFLIDGAYNFEPNADQNSHSRDAEESTDLNYFIDFNNKDNSNEHEVDYYYDSQVDFEGIHPTVNILAPKPIDNKGNPVLGINSTATLVPSYSSAVNADANNAFTMWGPDPSYTISATFGGGSKFSEIPTESYQDSQHIFPFFSVETTTDHPNEMPNERINIITITSSDASSVSPVSDSSSPSIISITIKPSAVFKEEIASTHSTDFGAEFW